MYLVLSWLVVVAREETGLNVYNLLDRVSLYRAKISKNAFNCSPERLLSAFPMEILFVDEGIGILINRSREKALCNITKLLPNLISFDLME